MTLLIQMHTAMLAGAARLLSARQPDLPGSVIFMFQPGEEGRAGARLMIEEGVLDAAGERPVAAYALHVFASTLEPGVFSTRPGPALAASDAINVTVRGRGGPASAPHRSADPIPAACEMVTALHALVTRRFDVFDPVVVTVGSIHAGTARNVIPDEATFMGTAESLLDDLDHETVARMPQWSRSRRSGITTSAYSGMTIRSIGLNGAAPEGAESRPVWRQAGQSRVASMEPLPKERNHVGDGPDLLREDRASMEPLPKERNHARRRG